MHVHSREKGLVFALELITIELTICWMQDEVTYEQKRSATPQHVSPEDASISGKKRLRRTKQEEFDVLEAHFRENPFLNSAEKEKLAKDTGMTPKAVRQWFSNRRRRLKRKAAGQDEIEEALKRPT
ncbi:hypothetical protein HK104_007935 [Borealophlyctis nickersoniae]|nr:hypothetical protein HK104_007935 [Borealophlyctis nickersoniae]